VPSRTTRYAALVAVAALGLAACSGGNNEKQKASVGGGSALSDCPGKVVVQTDWFPEPEHGGLYQMIDPATAVKDKKKGIYSGPTTADKKVTLEIRAGGPFIGFQPATALLYSQPSIMLGFINTDEQVKTSLRQPTLAVVSPLQRSPQILMWDPAKYQFATFADIGKSDAKVLYFQGAAYMDWLVNMGWVRKNQVDSSYDGSPTRFVSGEKVAQQAFVTSEPYQYEHELKQWMRPVSYLSIDDAGFHVYSQPLVGKPDVIRSNAACLKQLVPQIQRGQVAYMKDPAPVNKAITQYLKEMGQFWQISEERGAATVQVLKDKKIVANGPDGVLGSFDESRVAEFIALMAPLYEKQGIKVKRDLKPSDLVTNEFIDKSVSYTP
jgi:hypothetical protein